MQAGINLTSIYSKTKYFIEEILRDIYQSDDQWTVVILRYFNPCGAHPSGLIGEHPKDIPNNLMPMILKVADGVYPYLSIYGTDYPTVDGTCVRDFIHVVDVAKGHIAAMNKCVDPGIYLYNLGTGQGHSVKEMVDTFERVNEIQLKCQTSDRRLGDIPAYYASVTKAENELSWKCQKHLEDMCRDSWRAYQTNKN